MDDKDVDLRIRSMEFATEIFCRNAGLTSTDLRTDIPEVAQAIHRFLTNASYMKVEGSDG